MVHLILVHRVEEVELLYVGELTQVGEVVEMTGVG